MSSIYEYYLENRELSNKVPYARSPQLILERKGSGTYSSFFEDSNQCINYITQLYGLKECPEPIETLVRELYKIWATKSPHTKQTLPLVFSNNTNEKTIKINRYYYKGPDDAVEAAEKAILKALGSPDLPSNNIDIKTPQGTFYFTWGTGSLGRADKSTSIQTAIQEEITVQVFNKFWPLGTKTIDPSDRSYLEGTDGEQYSAYSDWTTSWAMQYNTLATALEKRGWSHKGVRAVRWSGTDQKNTVSGALAWAVNQVQKERGNAAKDTITPADILIYNSAKESEIVQEILEAVNIDREETNLTQVTQIPTRFAALKTYLNDARDSHKIIGVSLKKGQNFEAKYINFEPCEDFKDLSLKSLNFDPLGWICTNKAKQTQAIEKIRNKEKVSLSELKTWRSTKSLRLVCVQSGGPDIEINFRTNNAGYRQALVIEPQYKGADSNIGKCPSHKWKSMVCLYEPAYEQIAKLKASQYRQIDYDIDKLVKCYSENLKSIRKYCPSNQTEPEDLRNIFELLSPYENKLNDSVLWAIYNEMFFLSALFKESDNIDAFLRILLLAAEKFDESALPYLVLSPKL